MKNIFWLILVITIISCKSEKKNEKTITVEENLVTEKKATEIQFPEIETPYTDLVSIFNNGFSFTDQIEIEEIGILNIEENVYKIFYFLDDSSDLSVIKKLNIGFRFYPKDPNEFENEVDKKEKAKTIAIKGSAINSMENSLVIVSEEFKIMPNEFTHAKIFFYDPNDGIQGKTLTILNLNL